MNLALIVVDKLREPYIRTGCALYASRLEPFGGIEIVEVRAGTGPSAAASEGHSLLDRVQADDRVWALDRSGTELDSLALASALARVANEGARRLVFVIGGPSGLHQRVLARANLVWSLSRLTFLHEMARLVVLEQIYRAVKINRGEPYHR
jgi:23S rRNA (pseudouridine1915-N3)-methyltransferase